VDLYMISPDCSKFSRRFHGRDAETVVDGAIDTERVLAFVRARRAEIVVVENVAENDGVSAITTILASVGGYTWMKQKLSAREHAGAPVTREREFWVGLRGAVVLAAVAV
jgi:site-specific DNA-cytosine methylase